MGTGVSLGRKDKWAPRPHGGGRVMVDMAIVKQAQHQDKYLRIISQRRRRGKEKKEPKKSEESFKLC